MGNQTGGFFINRLSRLGEGFLGPAAHDGEHAVFGPGLTARYRPVDVTDPGLARDLGPGHTIVTILADYGDRYQSKLFNPSFLKEKGLPVPDWLE